MDTVMLDTMNLILKKVSEIDTHLITIDKRLEKVEERLEKVEERLEKMEERLDKIEERLDKMDERFDRIEERLDRVEDRLDKLENKVHEMGVHIENVIDMKTKALFDAYDVTKTHLIEEPRIKDLEEKVRLHDQVIQNHSIKLNKLCG